MDRQIPIINETSELADCREKWFFDEKYQAWCLEDILYTMRATTPKFQRMSIFAPKEYINEDGTVNDTGRHGIYTAKTAPVVFENNSAGYMQMPHTWLGGPRDESGKYLERGMVYVTCGCRGRESKDVDGRHCGKSPWTLIDLKTGIRFLRHNKDVLPGDFGKIISVGRSAGGAMSALVGTTGNSPDYDRFLEQNGAFMNEEDDVLAAQIYCPITDLDHADMAYEWQFNADKEYEASMVSPAGTLTPFQEALSDELRKNYVTFFNSMELKNPDSGEVLVINEDGRSGSGYDYLMKCLEDSAAKYLSRVDNGEQGTAFTSEDYIAGRYIRKVSGPIPMPDDGKDDLGLHHAGTAVMMPPAGDEEDGEGNIAGGKLPMEPPTLGDLMSRPPKGVEYRPMEIPMLDAPGTEKSLWLSWDGKNAHISSLDDYVLSHRRRMKPCPAFDTLDMGSAENSEFGTPDIDSVHFSECTGQAVKRLQERFPDDYNDHYERWATVSGDEELAGRCYMINPMNYIGTGEKTDLAEHFRIRVGAGDADTSFMISMALALRLAEAGKDTDYALVWDLPHCEADYPGEVCDWIESFTK